MKLSKLLMLLALTSALTACGGGDSGSDGAGSGEQPTTDNSPAPSEPGEPELEATIEEVTVPGYPVSEDMLPPGVPIISKG